MNIKILGSGREIGRSAVVVEGDKRIVMDYGVKIQPEPPTYPAREKFDAGIICHAHLDHVGAAPLLVRKSAIPVYMNDVTLELGIMLIKDSMKVAKKEGFGVPFEKNDVKRLVKHTKLVRYNEKFRIGDFSCSLWNSGHIPGSSSVLLENRKKVFYTSDIQTRTSHLLNPCQLPEKVDTLIIESTYGTRDQVERRKEEKRLVDTVHETIAAGGTALIPVLAVGRAQEVLMMLKEYANKIALDGMAKTASEIISEYSSYIKNAKDYKELLKKVRFIRDDKERSSALDKYPIIISSAGMLSGGPAVRYLREIQKGRNSSVIFTSFLAEDSPGYTLTQTNIFENEEERFDVHCNIYQMELSAHADRAGLLDIIKKTSPEQVVCIHGEDCEKFAKSIEEELGVDAFAPKNNETIKV
jgi:putative mRNA 3-end processing factor